MWRRSSGWCMRPARQVFLLVRAPRGCLHMRCRPPARSCHSRQQRPRLGDPAPPLPTTLQGSAHYENEQRKERAHEDHIARMRAAAAALGPTDLARCTAAMDAQLAALEAGRDLSRWGPGRQPPARQQLVARNRWPHLAASCRGTGEHGPPPGTPPRGCRPVQCVPRAACPRRTWLHVDMDAFFAAVEELERPELRGRAFAVGGMGMISTASYAARRFGVRSAMPGFIALKLCPDLVFVAPDFAKYTAASQRVRWVGGWVGRGGPGRWMGLGVVREGAPGEAGGRIATLPRCLLLPSSPPTLASTLPASSQPPRLPASSFPSPLPHLQRHPARLRPRPAARLTGRGSAGCHRLLRRARAGRRPGGGRDPAPRAARHGADLLRWVARAGLGALQACAAWWGVASPLGSGWPGCHPRCGAQPQAAAPTPCPRLLAAWRSPPSRSGHRPQPHAGQDLQRQEQAKRWGGAARAEPSAAIAPGRTRRGMRLRCALKPCLPPPPSWGPCRPV